MFCTYCGTLIPEGTNTCPKCGKVIIKSEDNVSQPEEAYNNSYSQYGNQYQNNQYQYGAQNNQYQNNQYGNQYQNNQYQYGAQNNQYQNNPYQNNPYQNNQYGGQYNNQYNNQYQNGYNNQPQETSTLSTLALVFSILGGWLGIVLSIGLCTYKNPQYKKRCGIALGVSIFWIIVGIIGIGIIASTGYSWI